MKSFKWVSRSTINNEKGYCKYCNCELKPTKHDYQRHENTKKHKKLLANSSINSFSSSSFDQSKFDAEIMLHKVKVSELKMCALACEQNYSLRSMDILSETVKSAFDDSATAQAYKVKRTKATALIKYVLGESIYEELVNLLANTNFKKFSSFLDETTDGTTKKVLAIVIRFFNEHSMRFETRLFRLKKVVSTTGQHLFDQLILAFSETNIDFKTNCIGFCSDNTNSMVGEHNSVWSRLKEFNSNIYLSGCVCHSLNSIGSWSSKKMPSKYEEFTRDVHMHFCLSGKRIDSLAEFQDYCELDNLRILIRGDTRWLGESQCVKRILNQWPALLLYFIDFETTQEKNAQSFFIYSMLNNQLAKCYFQFINRTLDLLIHFNLLFQSSTSVIHLQHKMSVNLYLSILRYYLKGEIFYFILLKSLNYFNRNKKHFIKIKIFFLILR